MKINGIHHVAIICSDYEKSKHFYVEFLGFEVIQETFREHKKSYKLDLKVAGKYQIELFSFPEPPKRASSPEACGLRHLAFEVDNVSETINELKSKGVKVGEIFFDNITEKQYAFFYDPDNLPLEVYQK